MGARIPHLIKIRVLNHWLNGMSRDNIAINEKISSGAVSNIIQEFKNSEISDIDLLREVALSIKKQNLGLTQFASSIRLRRMLDDLELPEDRIEKFLEHLCVFFYKHDDTNAEKFFSQVKIVSEMALSLDVSIYDILGEIDEKMAESIELDYKLSRLNNKLIKNKLNMRR